MAKRRVILLGNSVILGTVGSSLRMLPQFDVNICASPLVEANVIENMKPDVIFFDLGCPAPISAFSLLEMYPDLVLVGVSPDKNVARVWTGKQLNELSTQDLLQVINKKQEYSPAAKAEL